MKQMILLLLLILAGGLLRGHRLADVDTRSDEVELLIPPMTEYSVSDMWRRHLRDFKSGRQMPLPKMAVTVTARALHLEMNRLTIRLPFWLMGTLTIPALWLLGFYLGDRRLAWILAVMGVINPYAIHYSRVAHVYAFPLLFMTLAMALAAGLVRQAALRKWHLWSFCAATVLASYSHISTWPLMGLLWLLVITSHGLRGRRFDPRVVPAVIWAGSAVWILSVLPWAAVFMAALFTAKETFIDTGGDPVCSFSAMWRLPFVMTWGGGWRAAITLGLLFGGAGLGLRTARWRWVTALALAFGVAIFGSSAVIMGAGSGFYNLRYFMALWPIFILISGLGLLLIAELVARSPRGVSLVLVAGMLLLVMALAAPAKWVVSLPGNPTPYTMVNQWMDQNLPRGTLMIVDRWFEPWNEMRYHAPSNVIATFTIPNEPLETFTRYNWRQTVQDFFARNPEAVFFEMSRQYSYAPTVGEWDWPARYFQHCQIFSNLPGVYLRDAVLAPDEGYYAGNTNRVVVRVYYNTTEDVLATARADGRAYYWRYGAGWGHTKLWMQIQGDFRDWRILEERAVLEIFNLTDQLRTARVVLRGMAVNGAKRVMGPADMQHDFRHAQLAEWTLGPLDLAPGLNQVELHDPMWRVSHIPLFVDELRVE